MADNKKLPMTSDSDILAVGTKFQLWNLDLSILGPQDLYRVSGWINSTKSNINKLQKAEGLKDNPVRFTSQLWLWECSKSDWLNPVPEPSFLVPENQTILIQMINTDKFKDSPLEELVCTQDGGNYTYAIGSLTGEPARKAFQKIYGGLINEDKTENDFWDAENIKFIKDAMSTGFSCLVGAVAPMYKRMFNRGEIKSWDQLAALYMNFQPTEMTHDKPCMKALRAAISSISTIKNQKIDSQVRMLRDEMGPMFGNYTDKVTCLAENPAITKSFKGKEEYGPFLNLVSIIISTLDATNDQWGKWLDKLSDHLKKQPTDLDILDILENKVFLYAIINKDRNAHRNIDRNEWGVAFAQKKDNIANAYTEIINKNLARTGRTPERADRGYNVVESEETDDSELCDIENAPYELLQCEFNALRMSGDRYKSRIQGLNQQMRKLRSRGQWRGNNNRQNQRGSRGGYRAPRGTFPPRGASYQPRGSTRYPNNHNTGRNAPGHQNRSNRNAPRYSAPRQQNQGYTPRTREQYHNGTYSGGAAGPHNRTRYRIIEEYITK